MKTALKQDYFPGAADLAEGYMLSTEFSSTGGQESSTQIENHSGVQVMTKHTKFDDDRMQKAAVGLIHRAYTVMRTHCAPAFSGMHFIDSNGFSVLDREIQSLREKAWAINALCEERKWPRETRIEIYPFLVDPKNPRVALRVGRTMHELLTRLKSVYTADGRADFPKEWRNVKNLAMLVTGYQRDIVRDALRASEAQRETMIAFYGGRRGVAANANKKGEFDYGPIDKAINLYKPAANAFA